MSPGPLRRFFVLTRWESLIREVMGRLKDALFLEVWDAKIGDRFMAFRKDSGRFLSELDGSGV